MLLLDYTAPTIDRMVEDRMTWTERAEHRRNASSVIVHEDGRDSPVEPHRVAVAPAKEGGQP
jgi:hypothetical protein